MAHDQKILGVIGGLGPLATAHFMELVVQLTEANTEQENVDMIVYNFPSIPDRSDFIMGYYLKSPLHRLLYVANALARQDVDLIAIPCMTAHYFYSELSERTQLPIINAIEETAHYLKQRGIRRAGIMATEGTIASKLFHKAFACHGIDSIVPTPERQKDVNHLIYKNIKAGVPAEMDRFHRVESELQTAGAEVIVLGCTELSLIKRDHPLSAGYLDAMEVLAQQAVLRCGKRIKGNRLELITKGSIHP